MCVIDSIEDVEGTTAGSQHQHNTHWPHQMLTTVTTSAGLQLLVHECEPGGSTAGDYEGAASLSCGHRHFEDD